LFAEPASVSGKFLFTGPDKFFIRGVTYGTFRPTLEGDDLPVRSVALRDLEQMAAAGLNAVRVYTVPPRWFLDDAERLGLRIVVGIPWEQHVTFLDDRARVRAIEDRVRAGVRACAAHRAVLAYAVGNEIPASIVRWAGWRRTERHIQHLYEIAKAEDPDALVTYCNYPSTEYLELPFLDLILFNVYLEQTDRLERYLARLQNLAGDRPLVVGELGLDSRRNGEAKQARVLEEQLGATFAAGCAGSFVFSWTDEWHRGGSEILDWDFGLTTRNRVPKPALEAVARAFARAPFQPRRDDPTVSVVVCVYNGESTIADCLEGIAKLAYPDVEVLVVDDGSTDRTAEIAARFPFRLIRTANQGLSAARNRGLREARGEIVAYIDADARPDPHWLRYLVEKLRDKTYAGAGGPNLACPEDGEIADCVANAPGRPMHVLLSDRVAEHLPGCNMAFRRSALESIGGFDPVFRTAGDDVDLCWRLQERGWKLAYSPAAVVWHHQRGSVATYLGQQRGYGRAEAQLELKWPEKYNAEGQIAWSGRIYSPPVLYGWTSIRRIYHGIWGTAAYQSRHAAPSALASLGAAPEWYLLLLSLAGVALLGFSWKPLFAALPLLGLGATLSLWRAARGAWMAQFRRPTRNPLRRWGKRALTLFLFLAQPLARLQGRLANGLTPWRESRPLRLGMPLPARAELWSESPREAIQWLEALEQRLRDRRAVVARGGPFDRWDLTVRDGACGNVRLRMCIEEHGGGRQLVRFRIWPWPFAGRLAGTIALGGAVLAAFAAAHDAWIASAALGAVAAILAGRIVRQSSSAMALVLELLGSESRRAEPLLETAEGKAA
jgi:GT2 family glycosyltransferase